MTIGKMVVFVIWVAMVVGTVSFYTRGNQTLIEDWLIQCPDTVHPAPLGLIGWYAGDGNANEVSRAHNSYRNDILINAQA